MLRRLFSSASIVIGGGGGSPSSLTPSSSADKVPRSSRTRDDLAGFPQLVSRLDDFEGSLKITVTMLSRHCQAIAEMMSSSRDLDIGIQELYQVTESSTQQELEQKENSATAAVTEFQNLHIAPLLAEIPQLKVFCEHRNSALNIVLRYEAKVEEIQSTTRYESARLQRNRSKLQAATTRFKGIDENVRSEIARVLVKDVAELLGDSLEKVLIETQLAAAKQLQNDAQDPQKRIQSYAALAAQKELTASAGKTSPEATEDHPEESTSTSEVDTTATQHEQVPLVLAQSPLVEPNVSGIQVMPKRALNEEHSVCPQKKHAYGTRTWNLHRHIKDSMTTGLGVTECIQLPDGYQLEEWVAVHVIDFFNEISLLFGTIPEFCTTDSCPQMTAGPCYTYLWADGKQQTGPISLSAPEYVSCLMNWVQDQLDDPQVFPPDGRYECNPTFLQAASVIFKRLFRVYAHMYHSHLEDYVALHAESHLNFCFKRFIFFVKEFHMIDQKELNALRKLIQALMDPPMHLRA